MEDFVYDETQPHLGGNIDGGDKFTTCPKAWDYLIEELDIKTVLDVGCAQGHALDYFAMKGCKVLGVEGLQSNAEKCKHPVVIHDIQAEPLTAGYFDLVWCCEVSEHIEERYIDNLLTLISSGDYLAMTHAVPGQEGHHHVNCQEKEYWIAKLASYGLYYDEELTEKVTTLDSHNNHFGWHGLVFRRTK